MHKSILYPLVLAIVSIYVISCGSGSTSVPVAGQPTPDIQVGITAANDRKEMVKGERTAFYVKLNPSNLQGQVTKVNVHGDEGIRCEQSSDDMWTWYCVGDKETDIATVFADVTGAFPDQRARYPVKVIAPTPPPELPSPTPLSPTESPTVQPTAITATSATTTASSATASVATATCQLVSSRPQISEPTTDLKAEILAPKHCSTDLPSNTSIVAGGTYTGNLEGQELWVLVYPPDTKYYPQNPDACKPLAAQASGGRWTTPINLGGPPEKSQQYDIIVTVTDVGSEASKAFKEWLAKGCKTGDFSGLLELPQGLTELAAITVVAKGK